MGSTLIITWIRILNNMSISYVKKKKKISKKANALVRVRKYKDINKWRILMKALVFSNWDIWIENWNVKELITYKAITH